MGMYLRFLADESGATAIEYGLVAGLVSAGIIGALQVYGAGLLDMYYTIVAGFPEQ